MYSAACVFRMTETCAAGLTFRDECVYGQMHAIFKDTFTLHDLSLKIFTAGKIF